MNGINPNVAAALSSCTANQTSGQSMTTNNYGNCVMLNDTNQLEWCDLRGEANELHSLLVEDYHSTNEDGRQTFQEQGFTNIMFNADGNLLLCWNEASVGVVTIPQQCMPDGCLSVDACDTHACQFSLLAVDYLSKKGLGEMDKLRDSPSSRASGSNISKNRSVSIVQAAFHVLSPFHVVILLSNDTLLLTDALCDLSQQIFLQRSNINVDDLSSPVKGLSTPQGNTTSAGSSSANKDPFVRFCFGGNYDWMRLTLFLVTSHGLIYYLCPLLPTGALIPTTVVESLHAWVESECAPLRSSMKALILNYLRVVFGSARASATTDRGRGAFVEAGNVAALDWTQSHTNKVTNAVYVPVPCLQGPLRVYRSNVDATTKNKSKLGLVRDDIELKQCEYVAVHRREARASDICCPHSVHRGLRQAPVLAVSYEDGCVDLLVPSPACMSAFVSPLWLDLNLDFETWRKLVPEMVLVEEVHTRSRGAVPGPLRLTADPVFGHFIHATDLVSAHVVGTGGASTKGQSRLLAVTWLKILLDSLGRDEELEADDHVDALTLEATQIIPVLTGSSALGAISIVADAMVGHLVLLRALGGDRGVTVHVKNIATIKRAFDYVNSRGNSLAQSIAKKDGEDLFKVGQGMFQQKAIALIARVQAGLDGAPHSDSSVGDSGSNAGSSLDSTRKKELLAAAQHMNEAVIAPLEDLAYRTAATLDGLRDTYADQVELLESPKGLKVRLSKLSGEKAEALCERVEAIGARMLEQRTRATRLVNEYATLLRQKSGATAGEVEYRAQLEQWGRSAMLYKSQLAQLSAFVKVTTGEVVVQADGELMGRTSLRMQRANTTAPADSSFLSNNSFSSSTPMHSPLSATLGASGSAGVVTQRSPALFQSPPRKSAISNSSISSAGNLPVSRSGGVRLVGFGLDSPVPGASAGATPSKSSTTMTPLQARRAAGQNRTTATSSFTKSPVSATQVAPSASGGSLGQALVDPPTTLTLTDDELDYCTKILLGQDKIISDANEKVKALESLLSELAYAANHRK